MRVLDTAIQTGLAIAVLTLCAPAQAVTLVHPDGTLVGGKWQRWANQALVPTVRGPLIFEPTAEFGCGGADACSMRSPGPGEPATTAASDQPGLYFELGHQFDWTYLTNADRGRFARMWGRPHHPWVDSVASVMSGSEDGLEGDFAAVYEECAWSAVPDLDIAWGDLPPIDPRHPLASCALIRRIGRRVPLAS